MRHSFTLAALALDARHALRAVRKDLRLLIFAVSIIGLGVGACTAVFSVLNPLLLRQLPLAEAERLVWIANSGEGGMSAVTSRTSNLRDFRALSRSFDGLTGYNAFFEQRSYNLAGDGEPVRLVGADVAQDFLDVLGVEPQLGRSFVEEEGRFGGPQAIILSDATWTRQFGGDPAVVGTAISLNGQPTEVVGVLPSSFDFASLFTPQTRVDFLRPFPISDETDRWGNTISMIGRLAPGATVASAQAELDRILEGLSAADPARWGLGAAVSGLQSTIAGPFRSALLLLAAAAGVVMLIVCVNLSNLLLAKRARRSDEMAVRSALGAPRSRLVRQLLIESLLLSAAGALVGLGLAVAATRFVAGTEGLSIPLLRTISVDGTALLLASGLAIVVGLLVGMVPALQISSGSQAAIRGSRRGMSASRRSTRWRDGLVVAEVALACVLLVVGGLLLRSFRNVLDVELGFRPQQVAAWQVNATRPFDSLAEMNAFYDQIVAGVEAIPGVDSAGLTDAVPLGRNRTWSIGAPGFDYDGRPRTFAFPHIIDRRYLETLEIPLVAGRRFTAQDTWERGGVVILNQTAAKAVFQGGPALGRTVVVGGDSECEVIGIVEDIRHRSLEVGAGAQMYLPFTQNGSFETLDMVVRSSLPAHLLAAGVAGAIHAIDPAMPAAEYQTLDSLVERSLSPRRFTLQLLVSFAATALLLAALGIYGVLSYAVTERIPEIGVRMALGETGAGVMRRVVGKTLTLAAIGLAFGTALAFAASRWVASLLYDVESTDPWTFLAMTAVLLLVAALAGFLPALRASRTQAASVLRAT